MAQQIYNVSESSEGSPTDELVKSLDPLTTTTDVTEALEYNTSAEAAGVASYLNSLNNGIMYVIVGPRPKPHK